MRVKLYKARLVREIFIRTADENYIVARWCAFEGFHTDFFWLAVHAVEKYLKAILLLNGRTSKKFSHNIASLYAEVQKLAGELLPTELPQPAKLSIGHWRTRTTIEFVEWLYENGNPDNRYATYGYVAQDQDVHMLDQLVFALRRLCCELESPAPPKSDGDTISAAYRTLLSERPGWMNSFGMPLDKLIAEQADTVRRRAALNLNLAFAPAKYEHQGAISRFMAQNPVIVWGLLEPLESDDPTLVADSIEVAEWLLGNVRMPGGGPSDPGVREQIQAAVASARKRHGLSED